MNVEESLGARDTAADEIPHLGIHLEPGRRGRIPKALLAAAVFHALLVLVVLLLVRPRPEDPDEIALRARPTPVRVVFYQTKRAGTPPPQTLDSSDAAHRARSEMAPREPSPDRLPAARGASTEQQPAAAPAPTPAERRPHAGGAPPAPAPAPPPPAAEAQAEPPLRYSPDLAALRDQVSMARSHIPPSLEAASQGAGGPPSGFGEQAIEQSIRHQGGFGNARSGVTDTGPLDFDAKDFEWGPYARRIYEIIDRNWKSVIPLAARLPGVKGTCKVRFRILKSGRLEAIELLSTTGTTSLDGAALASIQLSDPLPPLPVEFAREDVGVTFAYFYNMPIDHEGER